MTIIDAQSGHPAVAPDRDRDFHMLATADLFLLSS
jgi:hypothetical protein